jgi:hypothetical protein
MRRDLTGFGRDQNTAPELGSDTNYELPTGLAQRTWRIAADGTPNEVLTQRATESLHV